MLSWKFYNEVLWSRTTDCLDPTQAKHLPSVIKSQETDGDNDDGYAWNSIVKTNYIRPREAKFVEKNTCQIKYENKDEIKDFSDEKKVKYAVCFPWLKRTSSYIILSQC